MRIRNGIAEVWPTRLARCLRIWRLLQDGPVHVGQLAKRFGVGERSIERDLGALRAAGVELRATGCKGWYEREGQGL